MKVPKFSQTLYRIEISQEQLIVKGTTMHPAMQQLSQLPVSDRLELVQELWDSICTSQQQLPIEEWHRELTKARLAGFDDREEELGLSREQVWQQVDFRRG